MSHVFDFAVLGCCGSYAAAGRCCSGYLLRAGGAVLWIDCGNGTLAALQEQVSLSELTGVIVSHVHPDHCVDLFGLDVAFRYGGFRNHVQVFAPSAARSTLGTLAGGSFGTAFEWIDLEGPSPRVQHRDLELQFSHTDHPVPTYAVRARTTEGTSIAYTADTGPAWDSSVFGDSIDLLVAEATYLNDFRGAPIHLTPAEAASVAVSRNVKRLLLTHLWPGVDPELSVREAAAVFENVAAAHDGLQLQL
ncbi:MAG: MBL fold metallo-hydrolase [Acidimicrobiia bacterium]